jgi:catechol 2,3-dioxygenase-like lactoylglutathione lyase family enzyme
MQLKFLSLMVQDQDKAVEFYSGKLGFRVKADQDLGHIRWLTLEAPGGIEGVELILEKTDFPPSADYQHARYTAGIPAIAVVTSDIRGDFERLREAGVQLRGEPEDLGPITSVVIDDTCGNLIHLMQPNG